jgi:hypothetical protein
MRKSGTKLMKWRGSLIKYPLSSLKINMINHYMSSLTDYNCCFVFGRSQVLFQSKVSYANWGCGGVLSTFLGPTLLSCNYLLTYRIASFGLLNIRTQFWIVPELLIELQKCKYYFILFQYFDTWSVGNVQNCRTARFRLLNIWTCMYSV